MICKNCGRESIDGLKYCKSCGADLAAQGFVDIKDYKFEDSDDMRAEPDNGYGSYGNYEQPAADRRPKHDSGAVSAGFYKFLCVCMGMCLIAGSVVWAVIMMRDRIDTSRANRGAGKTNIAASENEPPEAEQVSNELPVTTTTTATTTTTTTTTTDPFKQSVSPEFISEEYSTMYVIADELIIRIGPGYDYTRLDDTIPSGTALGISAEQFDAKSGESWCYVDYAGEVGWVSKTFLSTTDPTVAVVRPDEYYIGADREDITVTRLGGLKLYSGPGTDYDDIDLIPEGEVVTREGYNYFSVKWIYISYGEQYGWIQSYDGDWFNPTIE